MGLFGRKKFRVEVIAPGWLSCWEGNREVCFPVFDDNGVLVIAEIPSCVRTHWFFTREFTLQDWEFSPADRARVLEQVVEHFKKEGRAARVFERGDAAAVFHLELFAERAKASEALEKASLTWSVDYASVDLLHDEFGLEVCGIHDEPNLEVVKQTMCDTFPHWHHSRACLKDGIEPGWKFLIHMFRSRSDGCNGVSAE